MAVRAAFGIESDSSMFDRRFGIAAQQTIPDAMAEPRTVAVIPAFSEQNIIGSVVLDALADVDQVIVVDDCSLDGTADMARRAGATVLSMHRHRGEANALRTGLMEAERSTCSAVVVLEGGGKYLIGNIEKVLGPIVRGEADLVIGTLDLNNGIALKKSSAGGPDDSRPGVWAVSSQALSSMDLLSSEYGRDESILDRLKAGGFATLEVPLAPRDVDTDRREISSRAAESFLGRWVTKMGLQRPLLYLGLPGALLSLGGALLALMAMTSAFFLASTAVQVAVGIGMFLIGTLLVLSGLILNQMALLRNRMRLPV